MDNARHVRLVNPLRGIERPGYINILASEKIIVLGELLHRCSWRETAELS